MIQFQVLPIVEQGQFVSIAILQFKCIRSQFLRNHITSFPQAFKIVMTSLGFSQFVPQQHFIPLHEFSRPFSSVKNRFSSVTAFKILRNGYYWPSIFRFSYKWVNNYERCKLFTGRPHLVALPLKLVIREEPFQHWGLDFIEPINPNSSVDHTHTYCH